MPTTTTRKTVEIHQEELASYLKTLGIADIPDTAELMVDALGRKLLVSWTVNTEVSL